MTGLLPDLPSRNGHRDRTRLVFLPGKRLSDQPRISWETA